MSISQKTLDKRNRLITKIQTEHDSKVISRSDSKMSNVMLSERRVKAASKYKISAVPHPFTTREEYERSLQTPIGDLWNSSDVVRKNTRPEVKVRPGRIVEPIKLPKKRGADQTVKEQQQPSKKTK